MTKATMSVISARFILSMDCSVGRRTDTIRLSRLPGSHGLLVRIVGAGVPPAHQSRSGLDRVSVRQWDAPECGRCSALPAVPEPWPSGPPSATQRRTIGVVARGVRKGLRPRRWHAGGLHRFVDSRTGRRLPEVAPLGVFRSADSPGASWSRKTPRTARPVGRHMSADPGVVPARPGERFFPRAFIARQRGGGGAR